MYHKHFSLALTFLLTLNDINKPIHGFITPNVVKKLLVIICQASKSSILVPLGGHFGLFSTSNYQKNNIKMDYRNKINCKDGVFNLLTYTGPSPGPLPLPSMELTGEDGREV